MKIYTLVKLERIEDSESITLKHFESREEAIATLRDAAVEDAASCEDNGWEHDDIVDGMSSYSSWEDGEECHNHISLSIVEEEFGTPRKVRAIYGEDLINALDDIREEFGEKIEKGKLGKADHNDLVSSIREAVSDEIGALVQRTFSCKEEEDAYCKGGCDQDGWDNEALAEDYDWIPEEIWDEAEQKLKRL